MRVRVRTIFVLAIGFYLGVAATASARVKARRPVPTARRAVITAPAPRVAPPVARPAERPAESRPEAQTLRARPLSQQAAMGFGGGAMSGDNACKAAYVRCLELCGVRGNSSDCTSACGMRCLSCDFKRTGRTDALSSSCRR